jgi:hemoglobin
MVATYWLDQQDPDAPLSVLALTGEIAPGTEEVLRGYLATLRRATEGVVGDVPTSSQAQLEALLAYVEDRGRRGAVPGWVELGERVFDTTIVLLPGHAASPAKRRAGAAAPSCVTLYEELGGGRAVSDIVELLYNAVMADPALVRYFDGIDIGRIKAHQYAFLTAVLGGPEYYAGRSVRRAHKGLRITDEHFERMLEYLVVALEKVGADPSAAEAMVGKLRAFRGDVVKVAGA